MFYTEQERRRSETGKGDDGRKRYQNVGAIFGCQKAESQNFTNCSNVSKKKLIFFVLFCYLSKQIEAKKIGWECVWRIFKVESHKHGRIVQALRYYVTLH